MEKRISGWIQVYAIMFPSDFTLYLLGGIFSRKSSSSRKHRLPGVRCKR